MTDKDKRKLYMETSYICLERLGNPIFYSKQESKFDPEFILKKPVNLDDNNIPFSINTKDKKALILREFYFLFYHENGTDIFVRSINQSLNDILRDIIKKHTVISIGICEVYSEHSIENTRNINPKKLRDVFKLKISVLPEKKEVLEILEQY